MALTLGDNFSYQGAKPLDARLKYDTLAAMKAVADATMYDGCMAYCSATDKTYQWKSSNTVDPDTGKWREFSSGGSTGSGHTIEDSEGTDLTQRDTLQFGEGFKAEDDDTNEKTVITPDVMQSGDMDDVISPLPSTRKGYHRYSTEEQIVGTWIDGSTLYEKTFNIDLSTFATIDTARQWVELVNVTDLGIGNWFFVTNGFMVKPDGTIFQLNCNSNASTTTSFGYNTIVTLNQASKKIRMLAEGTSFFRSLLGVEGSKLVVTIQYTKA